MARCPHCGVFEGDNHHSLCPALQRKRDPVKHRHNGTDYPHANDCPHCWREASDIQSAAIDRLSAQLAEKERECERLQERNVKLRARIKRLIAVRRALENDDG